ncbi:hypothetical protein Avbf_11832 [Armadillidium vulgare]|nr:hypothetical protein Avbf_11832 [Armadillidium vulgare]
MGSCLCVENTFSLGDCIIQISKNQCEKFEKLCMLEAHNKYYWECPRILILNLLFKKSLSYPQKYGQYLGLLQSLLTDTKFESNLQSEKLVLFIKITLH